MQSHSAVVHLLARVETNTKPCHTRSLQAKGETFEYPAIEKDLNEADSLREDNVEEIKSKELSFSAAKLPGVPSWFH